MRRRSTVIALVITAVALSPTVATAQQTYQEEEPLPAPAPAPSSDDIVTHYYAWTATADAVSASLLIASAIGVDRYGDNNGSNAALLVGGLGLAFATPVIHATRGHGQRALGSYLLRTGFGVVGMGVGLAAAGRCDGLLCELDETLPAMAIGTFVGVGVAAVFDSLFLTEERTPRGGRPTWTPQLTASQDAASVGVAATF